MDIRDYLHAVRKRWRWVAGALLLAVGAAYLLNVMTTPRYASTVTFFVTTPGRDISDAYQGSLFSTQRVKSYAEVLTSDRLAASVAARGDLGLDAAQVRSRIGSRVVANSVLLEATTTDTSRSRSLQIAQSISTDFVTLVQSLETPPGSSTPSVKVEVVSGPELNPTPVSPRPVRNYLLATLLGLVVGIAVAVFRDVLDTSVRSADMLQRLDGGPLLASVAVDRKARQPLLLSGGASDSPGAEALRQLRTNLRFVEVDKPVRAVCVTSAVAGEGKTLTSANLAVVLAEAGSRVVLVDADLRRSRFAELFDIEGALGLTNVLVGQVGLDAVLQPWGGGRLWLLPGGTPPPNPSELLGSHAMADLLELLRARFDIVVVDTPPLLPVTDGAVVAAHADGTILVVRHSKTTLSQVHAALQALRRVDARILGCVLNMTPRPVRGRRDYYYYYRGAGGSKRPKRPPAPVQPPFPPRAGSPVGDTTVLTRVSQAGPHRP